MIREYFSSLAIGLYTYMQSTTASKEQLAAAAQESKEKAIWIVAMVVILIGIVYLTLVHEKVREKILASKKKKENTNSKNKAAKSKK